jgi:phosphoribosylaminoimidazole-succinocarboxamide synthase
MQLVHSGKVRDVYHLDGHELVLVASDRLSVYDAVLPTPIPDKGAMLTRLSLWFDRLADVVPHHVLSATDVPAAFAGRAIRCRRLEMVGVGCIARGYLAGLGLAEYEQHGAVSGVRLRDLTPGDLLPAARRSPPSEASSSPTPHRPQELTGCGRSS